MSAPPVQSWTRQDYERDAREYYASLPLEHFMEATPQATQREVTLASFNELKSRFTGFGYFNELLVQKRHEGKIERAVPDNMVVLGDPGQARRGSYALEHETCPLLWALEYFSRDDPEKDYAKNFEKYEGVFKFPYYLTFDPEQQVLLLYHLHDSRFLPVEENLRGRMPIPELHLEVGLLEGWVRFWFRGELLPVPAELREQMHKLRQENVALLAQKQELLTQKQQLTAQTQQLTAQTQQLVAEKQQLTAQTQQLVAEKQQLAAQTQQLTGQATRLQAQLKEQDDQLKQRDDQLKQQGDQLEEQQRRADAVLGMLRSLVEAKARQGGREDVLAQLPAVTDLQQLQAWLLELS